MVEVYKVEEVFSVIVTTYNTNLNKLYLTLDSILAQDYKKIELLVADDGSKENHFFEIKRYFEERKFYNYKLISDGINRGTVENFFRALKMATGKYVKAIGGGDLLFDEKTLNTVFDAMDRKGSLIAFGNMKTYKKNKNNQLDLDTYIGPADIKSYIKGKNKRIKKNVIVFGKFVSGASLFFERTTLEKMLNKIRGSIIYCEDLIQVLYLLENIQIDYIPQNVIWYELGEGISSGVSSNGSSLLRKDYDNLCKYLKENYIQDKNVKRLLLRKSCNKYNKYLRGFLKVLIVPGMYITDIETKYQKRKGLYYTQNVKGFLNKF